MYSSQISCQYFWRKLTYKRTTYLSSSSVLFSLGRGRSLPINFRSLQSVKALESCVLLRHFGAYLHFSFLGLISLILHKVSKEDLGKVRRRPEEWGSKRQVTSHAFRLSILLNVMTQRESEEFASPLWLSWKEMVWGSPLQRDLDQEGNQVCLVSFLLHHKH